MPPYDPMNDMDDGAWLQEFGLSDNMSTTPSCQHSPPIHESDLLMLPAPDEQIHNSFANDPRYAHDLSIMERDHVNMHHQDSDCSWTDADEQNEWYTLLRGELQKFRQGQRSTLLTMPLTSRQRKQVHSMANLWDLSHVSIGIGNFKRVLVSKCALSAYREDRGTVSRSWNPRGMPWQPGFIEPQLILVHWISSNICFSNYLQALGLPVPINVTIDVRGDYGTVYALFGSPADAATVILALDQSQLPWNTTSLNRNIECTYVHFPAGFALSPDLLDDGFHLLPVFLSQAFASEQIGSPNQPPSRSPSRASGAAAACNPSLRNKLFANSSSAIDESKALTDLADQLFHFPPLTHSATPSCDVSRRHSRTSSFSRELGYASASSHVDSDYSFATNQSKKRKREPMIPGGYPCSITGCTKVFDHDGERRKHEKNHGGERPHVCKRCGKGFLYPKDLRRHARSHGGSVQASPTLGRVTDASDIDELDLGAPLAPAALSFCPASPTTATNTVNQCQKQSSEVGAAAQSRRRMSKFSSKIAGFFGNGRKVINSAGPS